MVQLWSEQVCGYLNGGITADGTTADVWIVRYEDLVQQPVRLLQCLEELGLVPRQEVYAPIEQGLSHTHRTRQNILARMDAFAVESSVLQEVEDALIRCHVVDLVHSLDYAMPLEPAVPAVLPAPANEPMSDDEAADSEFQLVYQLSSDDEETDSEDHPMGDDEAAGPEDHAAGSGDVADPVAEDADVKAVVEMYALDVSPTMELPSDSSMYWHC